MKRLLLIPLLLGLSSPAQAWWGDSFPKCSNKEYSTKELTKRSKPGVVMISTNKATGSGFVVRHIKNQTLILTNSHVIKGANQITVEWSDGNQDRAVVVLDGGDTSTLTDLALLKVDGREGKVLPLKQDLAVVGEDVIAIGAPENLSFTLTKGVVSSLRDSGRMIQTDTAINPGSSGGPLINQSGCVIGVNTLGITKSVGLNFAISSQTARRFVDKYDPSNPPSRTFQQNKSVAMNSIEREREILPNKENSSEIINTEDSDITENAWYLLNNGKPELAIRQFDKAIFKNPSSWSAYSGRGRAKYYLDDLWGACSDLRKSLQLLPSPATDFRDPESWFTKICSNR